MNNSFNMNDPFMRRIAQPIDGCLTCQQHYQLLLTYRWWLMAAPDDPEIARWFEEAFDEYLRHRRQHYLWS